MTNPHDADFDDATLTVFRVRVLRKARALITPIDLSRYQQIVVLTGAGVSVASGLPTYRGKGGLWAAANVQEYATAAAMNANPARVWDFFATIRGQIAAATPNAAHVALANAEAALEAGQRFTILTQNVDGLHGRAGSQKVVELHGALRRSCCTRCGYGREEDPSAPPAPCPACPECAAPMRPAVVLFDEALPVDAEWEAKKALRSCDLFLAVGTSGTVSPASNFVRAAAYAGARTIYVNLEPMTPRNPEFQETYLGPAEELLPRLFSAAGA